jgi:ribonuclease D
METWAAIREDAFRQTRVGFDLEGDFNLHRYGRRICLFQIALEDGRSWLLDPLSRAFSGPKDWLEFKNWLEDPSLRKVIWAAQNDVRALKFCHGIALQGLFDLFDAARLTSFPKPSLPLLAHRLLGLEFVKQEQWQTSNWNLRPLTQEQEHYAREDVRYLLPLADALEALLLEKRQTHSFEQRMRAVEAFTYREETEPWLKVKGAGALLPRQQIVLKVLWSERETSARSADLAPWKVLSNEVLLERARNL